MKRHVWDCLCDECCAIAPTETASAAETSSGSVEDEGGLTAPENTTQSIIKGEQ